VVIADGGIGGKRDLSAPGAADGPILKNAGRAALLAFMFL